MFRPCECGPSRSCRRSPDVGFSPHSSESRLPGQQEHEGSSSGRVLPPPNSRRAFPLLHSRSVTVPSKVLPMIASSENSTIAANWACVSSAFRFARRWPACSSSRCTAGIEPRELSLQQEVVRACPHRLDRRLLPGDAGDDEKRQIQPRLLQHSESSGSAEMRHVVVAHDEVPLPPLERGSHLRLRLDSLPEGFVATPDELPREEAGVVLGVFDDEHAERNQALALSPGAGGGSFRTSQ